jgi:hypothetical protein
MSFLGLFDSEYKTTVATQVQRVVQDAGIPDSIKTATIKALFQEGNLPDYQIEELVGGLGSKAERMYRWAEDHYAYGLPSGEVYSATQGRHDVETVLELIEGQQISIDYSHFGVANLLHVAWMKLSADYGYDYASNEIVGLTAQHGGNKVYLKDMQVIVPSNLIDSISSSVTAAWGTAANAGYTPKRPLNVDDLRELTTASPMVASPTANTPYVKVTAVYMVGLNEVEQHFNLGMTEFDANDGFFQVKYRVGNQTKFWMYKHGAGTWSQLDNVYIESSAVSGSYFPMTYFRLNKAPLSQSSSAYTTSKKMLKKLGMDYDMMSDAINSNPNIGDVEQAILTFAVPSVSTDQTECRYLFDYFDTQHEAYGGNSSPEMGILMAMVFQDIEMVASIFSGGGGGWFGNFGSLFHNLFTRNTTVIQDGAFKMTLHNNGIYKRVRAGSIGAIDHYSSDFADVPISQKVTNEVTNEYGVTTYSESFVTVPLRVHVYRHQISANLYEEVMVAGLKMTYYIWNGYNTTADDTDDILLIPLDRTITENYSLQVREVLYARALHLVFNARATQEIKWYQQSWFQVVLIVVAVVLTVLDAGSDGGSWIASALQLTGTEAIIATVIFNLVVGMYVLPQIFKLFVKVFGVELATLIAIVAIVYGGYELFQNGVKGAPFAGDMLMLSTGLSKAIMEVKFSDLLDEAKMLQTYEEEKSKELETADELLGKESRLDPFVIFGEKPDDYFNRTVHYGNIGTLGITAISSYVDVALTLPKIQDTLGEKIYG